MRWLWLALLLLLVATNAAWLLTRPPEREIVHVATPPVQTTSGDADRVRELETEVRRLRRDLAAALRDAAAPRDEDVADAVQRPAELDPAPGRPAPPRGPIDLAAASTQADAWLGALRSLDDPTAKAGAVQAIRAALAGDDDGAKWAALRVLARSADVAFDRTGLREAILLVLREEKDHLTGAAFYALFNTDRQVGDETLVVRAVDAGYRGPGAVHLVAMFHGMDLTGDGGRAALDVLEDLDRAGTVRQQISGVWGARLSPGLEAKLLAMARSDDRQRRHDAIYFGLSTQQNKSREVLDVLLDTATGSDDANRQRAWWGLAQGVSPDDHAYLAERLGRLVEQRRDPQTLRSVKDILRRYPSPEGDEVLASLGDE